MPPFIPNLWEFHPALVHFPIAFLLAGVALELLALQRPSEMIHRAAAWLLLIGMISGWLAAAAGWLTLPSRRTPMKATF